MTYFEAFGLEPKLATFDDRLSAQKAVYLAQAAGADLGYFYRWYLRGPYCPAVADDLFAAVSSGVCRDIERLSWTLDEPTSGRLDRLRAVIGEWGTTEDLARRVELLASVDFLVTRKQVVLDAPELIVDKLREYGKVFDREDVVRALVAVRELREEHAT